MNMPCAALVIALLAALAIGCASRRRQPSPPTTQPPPATQRVVDADDPAFFTLDQIEPKPVLAKSATQPTTRRAPLDAVDLFVRSRAALLEGQRFTAINLLEDAIALDPDSFELYYSLGRAYLGGSVVNDKAIVAFERAVTIDPDHLELQSSLGRQYLAKNNFPKAIEHLRLAMQTSDYNKDDDASAVTDYFLARALQQAGYDRASLDHYGVLLARLQSPSFTIRNNAELGYLIARPEVLYVQIGELYEKHGDWPEALRAYTLAAERDPASFEHQARIVRALLGAGRGDDAARRASEVVTRFRASSESFALLREVYQKLGREAQVVDELAHLHRQYPDDRSLLFTYADVLRSEQRHAQAAALLLEASKEDPGDVELIRRLFNLHADRDDVEGAARLIVEAIARRPEMLREVSPMWQELWRPGRPNRLRVSTLQKIEVDPGAQAAKLFLVGRMADLWNRDLLARSAAERATKYEPPFAPAFRVLVAELWQRPDWDEKQKADASRALIDSAARQGDAALAAELRGLLLLNQNMPVDAVAALAEAVRLAGAGAPPDTQLTYAGALQLAGNDAKAEQALWKLISDRPSYDEAYTALFNFYWRQESFAQAEKVLTTWLGADPGSVSARVLQATIAYARRRPDVAQKILTSLFADHADDVELVSSMRSLYAQTGKLEQLVQLLEDARAKNPHNRVAIETLVDIYVQTKRLPDASRVLDATRSAVGDDPDLLYDLAHLYTRIEQKETTERILEEVVALDPQHVPASNDLGYGYADAGRELARAEQLIRVAVNAEPDNQSFLDSLGWVLYKRGKFAEAREYLEQAIGPAARPDPIVLDHLGDILYRLGDASAARKQWDRAMVRLKQIGPTSRDDLKDLRLQLLQKLKQQDQGQPVNVAPVVETAPPPPTAAQR